MEMREVVVAARRWPESATKNRGTQAQPRVTDRNEVVAACHPPLFDEFFAPVSCPTSNLMVIDVDANQSSQTRIASGPDAWMVMFGSASEVQEIYLPGALENVTWLAGFIAGWLWTGWACPSGGEDHGQIQMDC